VALYLLYQFAGWHPCLLSGQTLGPGPAVDQSRSREPHEARLHRPRIVNRRHGRHADHARQRRRERLVCLVPVMLEVTFEVNNQESGSLADVDLVTGFTATA
jgi:hypothetical protein